MKRRVLIGMIALAACMVGVNVARAANQAQEILAASDAVRNPARPFAVTGIFGYSITSSKKITSSVVDPETGSQRLPSIIFRTVKLWVSGRV